MPLNDDYESEKTLKKIVIELMPSLTEALNEIEENRYSFIIMIMDLREGMMQYGSDIDRRDAVKVVEGWLIKNKKQIEEDKLKGLIITDDSKVN